MISFREFLEALGHDPPYDWQEAFAERCAAGTPPAVVGVPTGAGKTTVVEALVWALAMQADRPAAERTVGVRTVWAIDRRILVDEVHARASKLAEKLAATQHDAGHPLHAVAARLAELGGGTPLIATRWRGGLDDPAELLGPLQPQIVTSTVAQIGSRLLFRGYGVAPRSLPLEAGLAACDTTICLDEAHLAEPFRQTVKAIAALRAAAPAAPQLPPTRTIMITATPSAHEEGDIVRLGPSDREQLGPRFTGAKKARLADAGERANERERVALLVDRTLAHLDDGADSVACVVNTVRRARAVWAGLGRADTDGVDLALLIGPQRPVDRDRILADHRGKLFDRAPGGNRFVCVTTQTFEVGLDADVEAMVTESASMQALVQRLGRLNRSGRREGRATIARDPEPWLYGRHERAAWEWLLSGRGEDAEIDVSVAALEAAEQRTDWPAPPIGDYASTLMPEIVAQLATTSPRPGAWQEPDIDAYLTGVRAEPAADVSVCWRADLRPEWTDADADAYRDLLLKVVPPQPREQITLSVRAARALIAARCSHDRARNQAARVAQDDADVDIRPPATRIPDVPDDPGRVPFVVIHRGDVLRGTLAARGEEGTVRPRDLEPGDVVVLPAQAGGCDKFGLAPADARPAADVAADLCEDDVIAPVRITPEALLAMLEPGLLAPTWQKLSSRCSAAQRLLAETHSGDRHRELTATLVRDLTRIIPGHPGLARLAGVDPNTFTVKLEAIGEIDVELDEQGLVEDDLESAVLGVDEDAGRQMSNEESAELDDVGPGDPVRPIGGAWALVPQRIQRSDELDRAADERLAPPSLSDHAVAVHARLARELHRLSLAASVRDALLLAARVHDHGKADPRFQDFFHSGARPLGAAPIAKSEFGTHDRAASRRSALIAGLPGGFSHEGASVAVLADALAAGGVSDEPGDDVDLDLAFVAVGTHHGRARPLPPLPRMREHAKSSAAFAVEAAGVAGTARGDGIEAFGGGAWIGRLTAVNRRYGAWGTAYLVGLLVLADRAVSAEGS